MLDRAFAARVKFVAGDAANTGTPVQQTAAGHESGLQREVDRAEAVPGGKARDETQGFDAEAGGLPTPGLQRACSCDLSKCKQSPCHNDVCTG